MWRCQTITSLHQGCPALSWNTPQILPCRGEERTWQPYDKPTIALWIIWPFDLLFYIFVCTQGRLVKMWCWKLIKWINFEHIIPILYILQYYSSIKPPYCIQISCQFDFHLVCDIRNGATSTSCRFRKINVGLLYAFMVFISSYFNNININKDGLYIKHSMDNKRQWKLFTNVLLPHVCFFYP